MGRRALRKIDPTLDLTGYLWEWDELPRPFSPVSLFRRSAPFEVEIGCGKGLFLASESAAHPDRDYLGIELARKYARFSAARLAKQQQTNAKVLCGDAVRAFAELFGEQTADAVHVYFPDPWWKRRHRKRRVVAETLVKDVARVLAPGGRLHLWTDVEDYFRTSVELITAATSLEGPFDVSQRAAEHDLDYRTHFERRMRLHDQAVYRTEFRRAPPPT